MDRTVLLVVNLLIGCGCAVVAILAQQVFGLPRWTVVPLGLSAFAACLAVGLVPASGWLR